MKYRSLLIGLLVVALSASLHARDLDRSRLHNVKALGFLKAKEYEKAVREFQRAFFAAKSSKPLINIAKTYLVLKRQDLAMDYYRMAIDHAESRDERADLAREVSRLKAELLQKMTFLQVRTPGVEADISIQYADTRRPFHECISPCDIWVDKDNYLVAATKKGYQFLEKPVEITGRGLFLVRMDMVRTFGRAFVNFSSNVEGAEVTVNGKVIGKTPMSDRLDQGKNTVSLSKEGYGTWETLLELGPGETQHVHVHLKTEQELLLQGPAGVLRHRGPKESMHLKDAEESPRAKPVQEATLEPEAPRSVHIPCKDKIVEKIVERRVGASLIPPYLKWVFWGVGLSAAGGGVGLQVVGNQQIQDANDLSKGASDYERRFFDHYDQGKLLTQQAYMLYGVAGVSAITGTVLMLLELVDGAADDS